MTDIARLSKYNGVPAEAKQIIIEDALERIGNETLDQIAQSHGISHVTLWRWLDQQPEYKSIMDAHYVDRLREAVAAQDGVEGELREAPDHLSLARAIAIGNNRDRSTRSAQWELQRRVDLYRDKPTVLVIPPVPTEQALLEQLAALIGNDPTLAALVRPAIEGEVETVLPVPPLVP